MSIESKLEAKLLPFKKEMKVKTDFMPKMAKLGLTDADQLVFLDLHDQGIKDEHIPAIINFLNRNPDIFIVDLGGNFISDTGTKALATTLKDNKSIIALSLSDNIIGDPGAESLATALAVNTTLVSLHMSTNRISNAGAQAFAKSLHQNESVINFEVSDRGDGPPDEGPREEISGETNLQIQKCLDRNAESAREKYIAGIDKQLLEQGKFPLELTDIVNEYAGISMDKGYVPPPTIPTQPAPSQSSASFFNQALATQAPTATPAETPPAPDSTSAAPK